MSSRPSADEDLLSAISDRDPQGIADLYDRYAGIALAMAQRVVGDRGIAEDVVQEAFLSVWKQAATFDRGRGSVRTWVLTVVRNRAVDRLRGNRSRVSLDRPIEGVEHELGIPDVWNEVSDNLDRAAIRRALNGIPGDQREAIEMAFFGGLTHVEISDQLGLPLGTVKGRMRIGLKKMRSLLEGQGLGVTSNEL